MNAYRTRLAECIRHHSKYPGVVVRDANLAKRFAVYLGLETSIWDEKTAFSPIVQYTCVVINLEKNSIFLNPAVVLRYFH